jgi:tetratricopeptide (TPR) repeat protein
MSGQSVEPAPNGEGVFQAELSDSKKRRKRSPLAHGAMWLALVVGIAIPMVMYWLPSEQAKWRIAAAQAKWLDNDMAGALQVLEAAGDDFPDNLAILQQRIAFYLEAKQYDKALADAERIVSLSNNSPQALTYQSQVLHHLGRHDEAVVICEEVLRLADEEWVGSKATALNALAYAQALGDVKLDEALLHINEAIRLAGDNLAMLDTRGFVHLRRGDTESARHDIKRSVEQMEQFVALREIQRLTLVRSYQSESERVSDHQTLAVLLYHRSLVYDELGMEDKARVDRARVRELGYEPNDELF